MNTNQVSSKEVMPSKLLVGELKTTQSTGSVLTLGVNPGEKVDSSESRKVK